MPQSPELYLLVRRSFHDCSFSEIVTLPSPFLSSCTESYEVCCLDCEVSPAVCSKFEVASRYLLFFVYLIFYYFFILKLKKIKLKTVPAVIYKQPPE